MILPIIIIIVLVAIDQLSKLQILNHFALGEQLSVIPNIFSLTYVRNEGAAWSILQGKTWFFVIITVIAVMVGAYFLNIYKKNNKFMTITIAMVLAGAIGNFIDRVRLGYVVDMFQTDFISFPIFNFADVCLVIGMLLICIYLWRNDEDFKK